MKVFSYLDFSSMPKIVGRMLLSPDFKRALMMNKIKPATITPPTDPPMVAPETVLEEAIPPGLSTEAVVVIDPTAVEIDPATVEVVLTAEVVARAAVVVGSTVLIVIRATVVVVIFDVIKVVVIMGVDVKTV